MRTTEPSSPPPSPPLPLSTALLQRQPSANGSERSYRVILICGFAVLVIVVTSLEACTLTKVLTASLGDGALLGNSSTANEGSFSTPQGLLWKAFESSYQYAMSDGHSDDSNDDNAQFPASCEWVPRQDYAQMRNESVSHICQSPKNQTSAKLSKLDSARLCYPRQIALRCGDKKSRGGLTPADRILLAQEYYYAESILEFGIGESTLLAAETNVPRYVGIDSSDEWISTVRTLVPDRFRFHLADVGPLRKWGFPQNLQLTKNVLNYQLKPLVGELYPFDVYTVDGRYRVACAVLCFLHALEAAERRSFPQREDPRTVRVLMHDYSSRPEEYSIVEEVATIVARADLLVVLELRPETTKEQLYEIWKQRMNQAK